MRYTTTRLTTTFQGVLPRSLAPYDGESLAGYVLRLSARLDRQPIDVGQLAGLAVSSSGREVPANRAYRLTDEQVAAFARATRMTEVEARTLTLQHALGAVVPDADGDPSPKRLRLFWIKSGVTRACPECLAGDHGFWRATWQMPWHFACVEHRRLLLDRCPACQVPYGRERATGNEGKLVPGPSVQGIPTNACRATTAPPGQPHSKHRPLPRCGHVIGSPETLAASARIDDDGVLLAQQRLLDAMACPPGGLLTAGGAPLNAHDWFQLLRGLCGLLRLARPDRPLAPLPDPVAASLDALARRRAEAADDPVAVQDLLGHGSPPDSGALTGALAVQALALMDAPDWDALVSSVAPLRRRARQNEPAVTGKHQHHSPLMVRRLVQGEYEDSLLNCWLVMAPAPYSRDWTFDARHVRHRLTDDAYDRHLRPFAGLLDVSDRARDGAETRLRRCGAVALVQMAHRATEQEAIALLGLPRHWGITNNLAELDAALARTGRQGEFRAALLAAAQNIEDDPDRPDHGAVRAALADWTIPDDDWARLVHQMQALQDRGRQPDWDHKRRLCTTAVVWELATGGEMSYAPVLHAVPAEQRLVTGYLSNYRTRLYAGRPAGFLPVIADYADQVAAAAQPASA